MQGKLQVKNFGVLKNIEIEINDFTIVIGSQAQGKSLLAKLVYFFHSLNLIFASFNSRNKDFKKPEIRFQGKIKEHFLEIFPLYLVNNFAFFEIDFFYSSKSHIKITKNKKNNIKVTFFDELKINLIDIFNNLSEKKENESKNTIYETNPNYTFKHKNPFPRKSTFIPAGRTYFSVLAKNIFSIMLISSDLKIDKTIQEFGSDFEFARSTSLEEFFKEISKYKPLRNLIEELICGKYLFENEESWIKNEFGKIKLMDSSSGQQEIIPIILVLLYRAITAEYLLITDDNDKKLMIIEEPEAHLFPESQYKITELFSMIYNISCKKTSFFVTTHSPYILSSLNNLIQANNSYQSLREQNVKLAKEKISEIIHEYKWIEFKNVSAYLISDGQAKNIMNQENKLIDANIIDGVSNTISSKFSDLLDLEFGE